MSVHRFVIVLVAVVSIGLYTVWQRLEAVRAGYKITELECIIGKLDETNHKLRLEIEAKKDRYELFRHAEEMKIPFEPYTGQRLEDILPHAVIEENASEIIEPQTTDTTEAPHDN
jgi:hypothetical protein